MGVNPAQTIIQTRCPALKSYTPDQSRQIGRARKDLRTRDPSSILLETNDDYLALREACRAIGRAP